MLGVSDEVLGAGSVEIGWEGKVSLSSRSGLSSRYFFLIVSN